MAFNFSKIKHLKTNSDMIFNLLLKYNINNTNSRDFVKDYLKVNSVNNTQGIKVTKLFKSDVIPFILEKLQKDKDYVKKMEEVVDKSLLKNIILQNRGDIATTFDIFSKMEKKMKEFIYITPCGIIRLMDDDFKEFESSDLKALYYNVMVMCAYEIDMKNPEDKRVIH